MQNQETQSCLNAPIENQNKFCKKKDSGIMAAAITSKGRDFYAILGVEKTAGQGQIKQAYR